MNRPKRGRPPLSDSERKNGLKRRSECIKASCVTTVELGDAYAEWCQIKQGLERAKAGQISHAEVARHLIGVHVSAVAANGCCCEWPSSRDDNPLSGDCEYQFEGPRKTTLATEVWSGQSSDLMLDCEQETNFQHVASSEPQAFSSERMGEGTNTETGTTLFEKETPDISVHPAFPYRHVNSQEGNAGMTASHTLYPLLASYCQDSLLYNSVPSWMGYPGQLLNDDILSPQKNSPKEKQKGQDEEVVEAEPASGLPTFDEKSEKCVVKEEKAYDHEECNEESLSGNVIVDKTKQVPVEREPQADEEEEIDDLASRLGKDSTQQTKATSDPETVEEEEEEVDDDVALQSSNSGSSYHASSDSDDSVTSETVQKLPRKKGAGGNVRYFTDEEVFVCNECGVQTNWPWMLVAHKENSHPQSHIVKCDVCNHEEDGGTWKDLGDHMRKTHGIAKFVDPNEDNNYFCCVCQELHSGMLAYMFHWESVHSEEILQCTTCKFVTIHRYIMARHMERLHSTMDFDSYKSQIKALKKPKRRVRQVSSAQCLVCSSKLNSGTLSQHLKTKHADSVKYQMFPCYYCGSVKKSHPELKQHVKIHGDEKYQCTECDYKSSIMIRLHKHVDAVHLHVKRFPCDECKVRFCSPCARANHQRTVHLGHRDFLCPTCGRGFKRSDALAVHIRIHTDEKPLACKFCDYRCRQQASMKWHLKKHNEFVS